MGGVRGHAAEDDIVFETKLQNLESLVRREAVLYQHPWFRVSPFFGLEVKHTLEPLQADIGVDKSRFGARIKSFRGGIRDSIISIDCSRPDYHRFQTPTIGGNTFDSSYRRPLNARTSVASRVILTDKDFDGVEHIMDIQII